MPADRPVQAPLFEWEPPPKGLSPGAELFLQRLATKVDRGGYYDGRPEVLRVDLFRDWHKLPSEKRVRAWKRECLSCGKLADGRRQGWPFVHLAGRRGTLAPLPAAKAEPDIPGEAPRRFFDAWQHGRVGVPFVACTAADLYSAFLAWCAMTGVHDRPTQTAFGTCIAAELGKAGAPPKRKRRLTAWPRSAVEAGDFKGEPTRLQCVVINTPSGRAKASRSLDDQAQAFQRALYRLRLRAAPRGKK